MQARFWVVLGLLLILSGCGPSGYYGYQSGYGYQPGYGYYQRSPYGQADPAYNRVPPEWYGNDPSLRQWYTFPYNNPELP